MRLFALFLLLGSVRLFAQQRDLDFFLQQANQHSPLLQDLQRQVAANQLDSLQIRAGLRPQVSGMAAGYLAPTIHGWGYDDAITNGGLLSAMFSVQQSLVKKGYIETQTHAITLQSFSARNTAKISSKEINRSITNQYLSTLGDRQQLDFDREVGALLQQEERILKRLTETNVYRQTDYLIFLTTIQQQQLLTQQSDNLWRMDLSQLHYLCGIIDTSAFDLADPALTLQPGSTPEASAFSESYRLDSLRIRNADALIDWSYRPRASVVADAGYNSSFLSKGYRNFGVSAGINLTVPIYDGNQRQLLHDKNTLAEQTRQDYVHAFDQQYRQQVASLYQQLAQTEQLINQASDQIKYSQILLEANGKLLRSGDVRMADYLLALNNYRSAHYLASRQRITRLQIINELNYWNLK